MGAKFIGYVVAYEVLPEYKGLPLFLVVRDWKEKMDTDITRQLEKATVFPNEDEAEDWARFNTYAGGATRTVGEIKPVWEDTTRKLVDN